MSKPSKKYGYETRRYEFKCIQCGKIFTVGYVSYRKRLKSKNKDLCKSCIGKNAMANMDPALKENLMQSLRNGNEKYWKTKSKEEITKIMDIKRKQRWAVENAREIQSAKVYEYKKSLSEDDKIETSRKMSQYWDEDHRKLKSDQMRKYLAELSIDEYNARINNFKNTMNSKSPEELADIKKRRINGIHSIDPSIKREMNRKSIVHASGTNKLHKLFEQLIAQLMADYDIKPEIFSENDISHHWDYGIFSNTTGNLLMLVDLDGPTYHGDAFDYNGITCLEEYDEKRLRSINSEVNFAILSPINLNASISYMLKVLKMDNIQFIEYQTKLTRLLPIPISNYPDKVIVKSLESLIRMDPESKYYKKLNINTRNGDRLVLHFHGNSIYNSKCKDSIMSPHDCWYNEELMRKAIEEHYIYINPVNRNKILQGFNIFPDAKRVSFMSGGRAKLLISKYLSEYNEIYDPFSGFSGRMLGAISLNKKYIGYDISEQIIRESIQLIEFLKDNGYPNIDINLRNINSINNSGEYECLFTSPPYNDSEEYYGIEIENKSCDEWIDIIINNYKCKKYLFVVDNTEKYEDYIVGEIKDKRYNSNLIEKIILILG